MLVRLPSSDQNKRLVNVTAATNCRESAGGTSVWTSPGWGAPMTCGSARRQTAMIAASGVRLKNSSARAPAVDAAVAIHQIWRAARSAAGTPGRVGGRPRPGAMVKTTNPASPHNSPSYQSAAPRTAKMPASTRPKPIDILQTHHLSHEQLPRDHQGQKTLRDLQA